MTLSEFDSKVENIIKDDIRANHYDTGEMYSSVVVSSTYDELRGITINIRASEYIQYLDQGEYVNYLLELDSIVELIATFYEEKVLDEIK